MANKVAAASILQFVSFSLLLGFPARARPAEDDVAVIVQRWTDANRRDFEAAQRYSYVERISDDDDTKTYAVTMMLGSPYKRLIEDGSKPVQTQQQQEDTSSERARRQAESPDERRHRLEEFRKNRVQAHRILEEMPHAFEYTLRSTRSMNSRTLYVLSAAPRKGYDPPNVEARVLAGMRGEFWIDTKTYQLFRGWARVLRPVSIEGFLATIQPGTEFEIEQRPVSDGIWLPTHFSINSRSHIVLLFHHHTSEDRTYFNYRKVSKE